jgi:hypothetical protein
VPLGFLYLEFWDVRRFARKGDVQDGKLTLGLVLQEMVDFARRTVICDDGEALVIHVENQVLALECAR